MSTFRRDIEITLDGETFKCQTRAIDYTNAERQLVHDGGKVETDQMALRFRIAYCVFRRNHPEHPAGKAFGIFLDTLDDINEDTENDTEAEAGDPLDPTPPAEWDT